jgi:hypothetical protein
MTTPAAREKVTTGPPTSGYALIVQAKAAFATNDLALKAARYLKKRFPMLQVVMVHDAERKRSEKIELTAA